MARSNKNRERLAPVIYKKSLEGFTHAEIQQWLADNNHKVYSISSIKRIVQYYRDLNVPEINIGEEKKRLLEQYRYIYNLSLKDYEISKQERKEKYIKKRTAPRGRPKQAGRASDMFDETANTIDETYIKTIEAVGDARLLKIAVDSLLQQSKLLGLDKDIDTTQDDSIIWEEIKTYETSATPELFDDSTEEQPETINDSPQQETN
jgi:hypothetical protein